MIYEEYKKIRESGESHETIAQREGNMQRGLLGEIIPTAGAIAGGVVGTVYGAPNIGAGVGGAAGEAFQQGIERLTGERKQFDIGQIAKTGVTSGVLSKGF